MEIGKGENQGKQTYISLLSPLFWHTVCEVGRWNQLHITTMKKTQLVLTRIKHVAGTTMLVASLALLQACGSDGKKESRTEDAVEQTGDAAAADAKEATADAREGLDEAGDDFERERKEAVANMNVQKDKLDAKIDQMQADIKRQGAKAKAESREELAELEAERKELGNDIDKAKNATAAAWKDVKAGFKQAGKSIGNAFDKAEDKLDKDGKDD